MKICPNCKEEVEDSFDLCWNCNYSFIENKVVEIEDNSPEGRKLNCLRCSEPMVFVGNNKFHEGSRVGAFGDLFELFQHRVSLDLYACPACGKVEFFIPQK
jgi:hypothetical protein